MIQIKSIKFKNHKILGNLELDFTDKDGNPVDTVILAGENGCGKTAVLNSLYEITEANPKIECEISMVSDGKEVKLSFERDNNNVFHHYNVSNSTKRTMVYSSDPLKPVSVYSEADTNYVSDKIESFKVSGVDGNAKSRRSGKNTGTENDTLMVNLKLMGKKELNRMTGAFGKFFGKDLNFNRIDSNSDNTEFNVVYEKKGQSVISNELSSGERQIIGRTIFLLKEQGKTRGCLVLIDEPERGLHPRWQKDILNYYKEIYKGKTNRQESQIFVATHSPFIIHNERRYNDKVIVLKRDDSDKIVVVEDAKFYTAGDPKLIRQAFNISDFDMDQSVVYVEGKTDEMYFNDAMKVFNYTANYKIREIGSVNKNGVCIGGGRKSLDTVANIMVDSPRRNIFLYDRDNDANSKNKVGNKSEGKPEGKVWKKTLGLYDTVDNKFPMEKGIERILDLNDFTDEEIKQFCDETAINKRGVYSILSNKKTDLCNYIINEKTSEQKKKIYSNFLKELRKFTEWLDEQKED